MSMPELEAVRPLFLGLGSNVGDRALQLHLSCDLIEYYLGTIVHRSSIVESAAWGYEDQPDFLNQVIALECAMDSFVVLDRLKRIEYIMGRQRRGRWREREIDIDIISYGDIVIDAEKLVIPHPSLENRRFVLEPLLQICPSFVHPVSGVSIQDMLHRCEDTIVLKKLA